MKALRLEMGAHSDLKSQARQRSPSKDLVVAIAITSVAPAATPRLWAQPAHLPGLPPTTLYGDHFSLVLSSKRHIAGLQPLQFCLLRAGIFSARSLPTPDLYSDAPSLVMPSLAPHVKLQPTHDYGAPCLAFFSL